MSDFELNLTRPTKAIDTIMRDIKRAAANHKLELDGKGNIRVGGGANFLIGGHFHSVVHRHWLVQKAIDMGDSDRVRWVREYVRSIGDVMFHRGYESLMTGCDKNIVPDSAINDVLNILFDTATPKITGWYQGPFTTVWTPLNTTLSSWAGPSNNKATELTNAQYDETNRQQAVFATGTAASQNIKTQTPTRFTLSTGQTGVAIYGSTLNNTTNVAYDFDDAITIAATAFSEPKTGLGAGDRIDIDYDITGSSA